LSKLSVGKEYQVTLSVCTVCCL